MKKIRNFCSNCILVGFLIGTSLSFVSKLIWDKYRLERPLIAIGALNLMVVAMLAVFYISAWLKGEHTDGVLMALAYINSLMYVWPIVILSILTLTTWRDQCGEYVLKFGNYWFKNKNI